MTSKNKLEYLFLLAVLIAAGFALADALVVFNPKTYTEVHHGSIIHYVPDNRDPNVSIERFPTEEPGPNEMITPIGQTIKKSEWEQWQRERSPQGEASSGNAQDEDIRTIEIIGTDQMKFVVGQEYERIDTGPSIKTFNDASYPMLTQIQTEPGERIRIRLNTLSQLRPEMMSHNWVLLAPGVDAQAFVNAANPENDYLPSGREDDIIAHTELAAGGETVEVTFTAPEEPGIYDFLCSFMAHFAAGMRGELIVQL